MSNTIADIRKAIKEMDVQQLRGISCDLYAKISECYLLGDLTNYTKFDYVKSIVDDEIILRETKDDIQDRLVQRFALWDVPSWND